MYAMLRNTEVDYIVDQLPLVFSGWTVVQIPDDVPVTPGWHHINGQWLDAKGAAPIVNGMSLALEKQSACGRLQAEKWARMMGQFRDTAGHLYDVDADSRALLNGKVTTINSGKPLPAGFVWKTAEKDAEGQTIYAPHTAETLIAMAFELEDWTESIFRASEAAQGAVMAALDTEAALAAEAAVLWP